MIKLNIVGTDGILSENSFEIQDVDLELFINTALARSNDGEFYLIYRLNGEERRILLNQSGYVTIPADWIKTHGVGILEFELLQKKNGRVINAGTYHIPPINITKTPTGWHGSDFLKQMIADVDEYKKSVAEIQERQKNLLEEIESFKKGINERDERQKDTIKKLYAVLEIVIHDRYALSIEELAEENKI